MQVSDGFQLPADRSRLVLVGALVGDELASDDTPWLAIVNHTAASSREIDIVQIRREPTHAVGQRRRR